MSELLLIARKDGKSSSRRQRRLSDNKVDDAITRWANEGFNCFWLYGPQNVRNERTLIREWRAQ